MVPGPVSARSGRALQAPAITMIAPGSVHGFRYAPDSFGHQITIPTATLRTNLQGVGQPEAELGLSFVLGAGESPASYRESLRTGVRLSASPKPAGSTGGQ